MQREYEYHHTTQTYKDKEEDLELTQRREFRISPYTQKLIKEIQILTNQYDNDSHVIRAAIMKLHREVEEKCTKYRKKI